ncbi:G-protein coupled receptor dmsr-1-like [Mercenaria mercenaria]|uniref:G-protein coupled receptor dmsr-1-like n=1 Tax=Mercenaria mercenaria TaxID=6596 RepID=UPI00234FB1C7|nr:G-protein coupled receptor dmsr-1-like [Mercenaria mercenaria]
MAGYGLYANTSDSAPNDYEKSHFEENYMVNALKTFDKMYKPVHGYLAVTICVFGITANILNITVLTRKGMISFVHIFLTGLAISDGITMALYCPFLVQMYLMHGTTKSPDRNTEGAVRYQVVFAVISTIVHSISIWLTVTLAVFRYLFIRFPRIGLKYGNTKSALAAEGIVVIMVTIICIPNSILYQMKNTHVPLNETSNDTSASIWSITKRNDVILEKVNYWMHAIFTRLLPSCLLMIFSVFLIITMRQADKRRNNMTLNNTFALRSRRTTKMLLAVVLLSVIAETPHGVLLLLSGLIPDFFANVYVPLGDMIDILTLINDGVNFVLYCTMSKQFRKKFLSLFCRCANRHS